MEPVMLRGRVITEEDVLLIRRILDKHLAASRTAISKRICELWGWFRPNSLPKDCACREILRTLDARGLINLIFYSA